MNKISISIFGATGSVGTTTLDIIRQDPDKFRIKVLTSYGNTEKLISLAKEFNPEFILISAGFDAHEDDPLAQFNLKTEDYYTITKRILEASKKFCNGKVVSILEGGYDLKALRDSTERHVDALLEFD